MICLDVVCMPFTRLKPPAHKQEMIQLPIPTPEHELLTMLNDASCHETCSKQRWSLMSSCWAPMSDDTPWKHAQSKKRSVTSTSSSWLRATKRFSNNCCAGASSEDDSKKNLGITRIEGGLPGRTWRPAGPQHPKRAVPPCWSWKWNPSW